MCSTGPLGNILLVDDDVNIVDLLRFNLNSEGFGMNTVSEAKNVTEEDVVKSRIVIVDAMGQEYNGLSLVRDFKDNPSTTDIPFIICTNSYGEDSILDAFDAGADDYVSKPFSLRELIARIKAVLRRHPIQSYKARESAHAHSNTVIDLPEQNLHIDTTNQRVSVNGANVSLTKTEYSILVFLIKNQNSFFTRNEICQEVWKEDVSSNERIVDTNISRLRKKLGESGRFIINRYGLGYAFVDKLA